MEQLSIFRIKYRNKSFHACCEALQVSSPSIQTGWTEFSRSAKEKCQPGEAQWLSTQQELCPAAQGPPWVWSKEKGMLFHQSPESRTVALKAGERTRYLQWLQWAGRAAPVPWDPQLALFLPCSPAGATARLFCPSRLLFEGKAHPDPTRSWMPCSHLLTCPGSSSPGAEHRASSSLQQLKVWGPLPAAKVVPVGQGSLFLGHGYPGIGTVSARGLEAQTLPCISLPAALQLCLCVFTCGSAFKAETHSLQCHAGKLWFNRPGNSGRETYFSPALEHEVRHIKAPPFGTKAAWHQCLS